MDLQIFNQVWIMLLLIIPIILISRSVVAGTRYSPILIIVVFGLIMGLIMVQSNVVSQGFPELPLITLMSRVTIIVLICSFFVGGQELRKIIFKRKLEIEPLVSESQDEVTLGTKRTQFVFIVRSVFILLGIASASKLLVDNLAGDPLKSAYPLLTYIGLIGSIILVDSRATIKNKPLYLRKGITETLFIIMVLVLTHFIALWIEPVIGLPQIFFAMLVSASLGFFIPNWQFGPTIRALLFAGIPTVLAANFLIGGSRILDAFSMMEMRSVIAYGFFGQLFWMFGGLALLILLGRSNHVRNLAPGMAGSLSHSGLTGACTAGDFGQDAAARAPIMINIPFFGHIFVFSILAYSAQVESLAMGWITIMAIIGVSLTALALSILNKAKGSEVLEVKGLMLFSFSWQVCAVFGSFLVLGLSQMSVGNAGMATSSALSHFGLFAAIQGGLFGDQEANLIPFIFAMPFLVHPLVFGIFGKAMSNKGKMPEKIVYALASIGLIGVVFSLLY